MAGLLAGFQHASAPASTRVCPPASARCAVASSYNAIGHEVFTVLGGMLLGAAVGVGAARLIPLERRETTGSARFSPTTGGGRWITARFKGHCRRCGQTVYPGDRVMHFRVDRKVACRACAAGR